MKRIVAGLALVLAVSGCSDPQMVGRSEGGVGGLLGSGQAMVPVQYHVARVDVVVPQTLRVSEENRLIPQGDIVWHGDATGDRYVQVKSIMDEAARRGTAGMGTGEKVVVTIEMMRFHALSPVARATTGGNFATRFILTVKDARTGQVVDGPRVVVADCPAAGGARAKQEEAQGITQRMVIVDHVSGVIQHELSQRVASGVPVVSRSTAQPTAPAL